MDKTFKIGFFVLAGIVLILAIKLIFFNSHDREDMSLMMQEYNQRIETKIADHKIYVDSLNIVLQRIEDNIVQSNALLDKAYVRIKYLQSSVGKTRQSVEVANKNYMDYVTNKTDISPDSLINELKRIFDEKNIIEPISNDSNIGM